MINDKQKAIYYVQLAISAGWELKSIRKNKVLSALYKELKKGLIAHSYDSLITIYVSKLNLSTRKQARKMFKKDQKMAIGALLRIGDHALERYTNTRFAPHSEGQIQHLISQLNSIGYPDEQITGNDYWMSTIISHHNSISTKNIEQDTLFTFLRPNLEFALYRGEISPYEFETIDDWHGTVLFEGSRVGYGYLNPPQQQRLHETNQMKSKIGLRSIELRNQLIKLEKKTGISLYLPDWVRGEIRALTN
ncbi:MAG: hypothetical protein ACI8QD_000923 [Cyclobacteriaceae bacterium]|jgi:hypothetical protein